LVRAGEGTHPYKGILKHPLIKEAERWIVPCRGDMFDQLKGESAENQWFGLTDIIEI